MKIFQNIFMLTILCCLLGLAASHKASKLFKFDENKDYAFLSKFSVGEGHKAQFHFKAGFSKELTGDEVSKEFVLHFAYITDDHWDYFLDGKWLSSVFTLDFHNFS